MQQATMYSSPHGSPTTSRRGSRDPLYRTTSLETRSRSPSPPGGVGGPLGGGPARLPPSPREYYGTANLIDRSRSPSPNFGNSGGGAAPRRDGGPPRKPTALNLTTKRRSDGGMPHVLPSPTVPPAPHKSPGSINFPRLNASPTHGVDGGAGGGSSGSGEVLEPSAVGQQTVGLTDSGYIDRQTPRRALPNVAQGTGSGSGSGSGGGEVPLPRAVSTQHIESRGGVPPAARHRTRGGILHLSQTDLKRGSAGGGGSGSGGGFWRGGLPPYDDYCDYDADGGCGGYWRNGGRSLPRVGSGSGGGGSGGVMATDAGGSHHALYTLPRGFKPGQAVGGGSAGAGFGRDPTSGAGPLPDSDSDDEGWC